MYGTQGSFRESSAALSLDQLSLSEKMSASLSTVAFSFLLTKFHVAVSLKSKGRKYLKSFPNSSKKAQNKTCIIKGIY